MKRIVVFLVTSAIAVSLLNACGSGGEETQKQKQTSQEQEQASQKDSLKKVRQQSPEQQRQDSIEQARQDSIEAAKKQKEKERNKIKFDSDGAFSVQVESWRSKHKAQEQVQKWVDRGYENAYVVKYGNEETGDVWFRVRLGRLATKEMAEKLESKLAEEYNAKSWISMAKEDTAETMSEPGE